MDEDMREIKRLEVQLIQTMVALVVRDPDGMLRIEQLVHRLRETGIEISETGIAVPIRWVN